MQIIKKIYLDFYDRNYVTVNAKQGDTGRVVRAVLVDEGQTYDIPQGATARIASGTIWNNCTISDNEIMAPLTTDMLAESGERRCQIELLLGNEKLTSVTFRLRIEKSERDNNAMEGDSRLDVLDQAISDAIEATGNTNTATRNANTAAAAANAAAQNANTEASLATAAASAANTATTAANIAAGKANTAATAANNASDKADAAGDRANAAADKAEAAAGGDISYKTVDFTEAVERSELDTGGTIGVLFGQIQKWFSDLRSAAFSDVENTLTHTAAGRVLDARQGKTLADRIGTLGSLMTDAKSSLVAAINEIKSILGSHTHDSRYYQKEEIFDKVYPVGSIYINVNNVSPETLFGGTWVAWGSGRVPVGVEESESEFDTSEKTGGNKSVSQVAWIGAVNGNVTTIGYAPASVSQEATNKIKRLYNGYGNSGSALGSVNTINHPTYVTDISGDSTSVLQPYITCYMWKRTE